MHRKMIMYNAKDRPLPANHSFTHNVASLLASTFRSSCHVQIKLGARCFAKANICFRLFAAGNKPVGLQPCGPWPFRPSPCGAWPLVCMESPSPFFTQSSMFAKANISFHSNARIPCALAKYHINDKMPWYKGKVRFQQSHKYAF